jgi:hypothetical protein
LKNTRRLYPNLRLYLISFDIKNALPENAEVLAVEGRCGSAISSYGPKRDDRMQFSTVHQLQTSYQY